MNVTQLSMVAALTAMTSISSLHAQNFSGKKITDVKIEYSGDKTVDAQRIKNFMSSRIGTKYNPDKLDSDIRALYKTGLVDNVTIKGSRHNGGVRLTAEVTTRPVLASLGFVGNTKYSDKRLARVTKLESGKIIGASDVVTAREKLQTLYSEANFPDVTIKESLQKSGVAGHANLIFTIEEGAKNTIRKIHFQGNKAFDHNLLYKEIKTRKKGIFSFITKSGTIDNDKLSEDVERVVDFYKDNGYLKAFSPGAQIQSVEGGKVDIIIPVNEGIKYSVTKVSFGALTVFSAKELLPSLILDPGDPYSQSQLREDIKTIRAYYGSRGYADARVIPKISDAGSGKLAIRYDVTEGKPSKVGRINIAGNSVTKDSVIRREVTLRPGEPFNSVELETIQNRLKSMNYFKPIYVDDRKSAQAGFRDIDIQVREQKTGSLTFGVGLSSIDNVVGYVGLTQRNFDITNFRNFRGGGQRFSIDLKAGSETTDARISLVEPWFLGQKLEAGIEAYYRDLLYLSDEYDLTKGGGAIHFRKAVGKRSSMKLEVRWEKNDVTIENDVATTSAFNQFEGDTTRTATTLSYIYDSRNAVTLPRRGHKIDTGITYSTGDTDTYGAYIKAQKHWNFKYDAIFSLKGEYATTDTHGDNSVVPIFDRHFLGGARNLRGFEFNDVGPRDTGAGNTNEVFGGTTKGFITAEMTLPLVDNVRGAGFIDAGFVSEDSWAFDSDLYIDAGLGLRLNLPIGPLAIDYAIPFKSPDDEADKGGQFNFYLNYSF